MAKRSSSSRRQPPAVFKHRLVRVRDHMADQNLGAILLSDPADIRYCTGFDGEDSIAVVTARTVRLVTDSRFTEQARQQCPWVGLVEHKGGLSQAIAGILGQSRCTRAGFQADHLTYEQYRRLNKAVGRVRLVAVGTTGELFRQVKDNKEVTSLKKAVDIAQRAFRRLRRYIEPGRTESELAARLDHFMRLYGASGSSFPTICAAGANSALPHAVPGSSEIRQGRAVLFDWGAVVDGYRSDLTRTLFVGRIPPRLRRVYSVVLEAQQRAIEAIRPGVQCDHVDAIAREVIGKAGFGKQFGHGLGHGIGLHIHEYPVLSGRCSTVLEEGMVVTVEPGVYIPGTGGVRIEDDVLVTASGSEVLSTLPKDIDRAVV